MMTSADSQFNRKPLLAYSGALGVGSDHLAQDEPDATPRQPPLGSCPGAALHEAAGRRACGLAQAHTAWAEESPGIAGAQELPCDDRFGLAQ